MHVKKTDHPGRLIISDLSVRLANLNDPLSPQEEEEEEEGTIERWLATKILPFETDDTSKPLVPPT